MKSDGGGSGGVHLFFRTHGPLKLEPWRFRGCGSLLVFRGNNSFCLKTPVSIQKLNGSESQRTPKEVAS